LFRSVIRIFKNLFNTKRSKLTFKGRAGIVYDRDSTLYFIDSELLAGDPYDNIVIWAKSVRYYDDEKKQIVLTHDEKKVIAEEVKLELESMGIKVDYEDKEDIELTDAEKKQRIEDFNANIEALRAQSNRNQSR
jgi:hypothetical protein